MRRLRLRLFRRAIQKILLFLLLFAILGPLGIVPLHLQPFFRRELRQVADEAHQLPAILSRVVPGLSAECRHSRQTHSVFDNPEKLAVRKFLRVLLPQVRRLWIQPAHDLRVAASVVSMADRAMIREVQPRLALHLRRIRDAIGHRARVRRNRNVPDVPRDKSLQSARPARALKPLWRMLAANAAATPSMTTSSKSKRFPRFINSLRRHHDIPCSWRHSRAATRAAKRPSSVSSTNTRLSVSGTPALGTVRE